MTSRSKRVLWNTVAFAVMVSILLLLYGAVVTWVNLALHEVDWWVRAVAGIVAVWGLQWAVGKWLMRPMFELFWWGDAGRAPGLLRRGVPPEQ